MGVRGLTTFIAKNQDKYFKKHKLRDCYVVIDAHSLCARLYLSHTKSNDSFGGDYDKYGRVIEHFFSLLKRCNITPIVIFDGGYEKKKLKTVFTRLRSKIKAVRRASPAVGATVFPLFVREVMRDVVLKLGLYTARCDFEADYEIACIARQLNCPVISYDSDFYIFDVLYIPFPTMDFYVTKIKDGVGNQNYIACKIYKIEYFLKQFGGLDKSHIPLMATILGNDYIGKGSFKFFYSQLRLAKRKEDRGVSQRHIIAVIKWLQGETYESALRKVLGRIKKKPRQRIAKQIRKIMLGYICTESEILQFLNIPTEKSTARLNEEIVQLDLDAIETDSENDDCDGSDAERNDSDEKLSEGEETIDITTIHEVENVDFPEWFMVRYRHLNFPTMFMDILSLHNCFYTPQVENTYNVYTIEISLPIVRAIAKILLNDVPYFIYWARNEYGRVKKYNVEVAELNLPNFTLLENIDINLKFQTFVTVLGMDDTAINMISYFPPRWQLYFYALVFWAKNAVNPTVTLCHIYSILLCLLHIDIVDDKIGYYRLKSQFLNKYSSKLKVLLESSMQARVTVEDNARAISYRVNNYIANVNKDDCILYLNRIISNFNLDEKLQTNPRLYNIFIVDAFAQFQNCLYYIKHLNCLLLYPIADMYISNLFNGTFVYNLCRNLESRYDIDAYVHLLLKCSPSIYDLFQSCLAVLKSSLPDIKPSESIKKKRRRRRKKAESSRDYGDSGEEIMNEINTSDREEFDVNNKFSLLRFVTE